VNEEIFPPQEVPVAGPGRLLQAAREEKNLRAEDVAYEIRLTPSQVLALEENDYSRMPEETYVRGYLRNYARLVGVPENDILMAFARYTRSSETKPLPVAPTGEGDINKGGNGIRLLAAAIFLAVILISAIWVFEPYDESASLDTVATPVVTETQQVETKVPLGSSKLNLEEAANKESIGETFITPGTTTEPEVNDTATEPLPEVASTPDVLPGQQTDQTSDTVADSEGTDEKPGDDNAGKGTLLISYDKDSWTDVRDANGQKLIYRTVKAGEKIALAGPLPFSLFFGYAQGVKVTFNGEEVDVAAHTRGVFARFTVGDAVDQ
jgi:cytoskeleton protein RodZ